MESGFLQVDDGRTVDITRTRTSFVRDILVCSSPDSISDPSLAVSSLISACFRTRPRDESCYRTYQSAENKILSEFEVHTLISFSKVTDRN